MLTRAAFGRHTINTICFLFPDNVCDFYRRRGTLFPFRHTMPRFGANAVNRTSGKKTAVNRSCVKLGISNIAVATLRPGLLTILQSITMLKIGLIGPDFLLQRDEIVFRQQQIETVRIQDSAQMRQIDRERLCIFQKIWSN